MKQIGINATPNVTTSTRSNRPLSAVELGRKIDLLRHGG
jgi:hypothetical protein